MKTKVCSICKTEKLISEFYRHKGFLYGVDAWCKECHGEKYKNYRRTKEGLISYIYTNQKQRSKKKKYHEITYTLQDLQEWAFSQKLFHELYDNWKISNYDKMLIPSFDRKDDYKGYFLSNLQIMTWVENNIKGHKDRKNGINNKHSKAVVGINKKTGEKISFYSIIEAHRRSGIHLGDISECCIGKSNRKSAGGYIWEFKEN